MRSIRSRALWSLPFAFLALIFGGAHQASASAIYFAEAKAVIEFTGLEHAGGGVGVNVFSSYYIAGAYNGVGGDGSDWTADYSSDVALAADRIDVGASVFGWAADGSASSVSGIDGWFQIDNSSSFDATAFFLVSGLLDAETDVSHTSLGQAFAYASIRVESTRGGKGGFASVQSSTTAGADSSSRVFGPTIYSMTVPPGGGDFFFAHPSVEGFANAVPASVPEPGSLTLLAFGLAAARSLGRRRH